MSAMILAEMTATIREITTRTNRRLDRLDAARLIQTQLLKAIIVTHPEPAVLRDAWLALSSGVSSLLSTDRAMGQERLQLEQDLQKATEEWSEYLASLVEQPRDQDDPED